MDKSIIKNELVQLYNKVSKHSNYQILASNFQKHIMWSDLDIQSRYEKERWKYITSMIEFSGKKILDIGGNTGFFSFEAANKGARYVDYYEGNLDHARFVSLSADYFDLNKIISVHGEYYIFDKMDICYDISFLLNVLHHLGDDYGDASTKKTAKQYMLKQLIQMSFVSKTLVFQLGYNWKGRREENLFENGSKQEQIDWIIQGTREHWEIEHIGIAVKSDLGVEYMDMNEENVKRFDYLGEFLNRPLFILKSKHFE